MKTPVDFVREALVVAEIDAVRLFHGRGGVLSGWKHVSIDWYAPLALMTLYENVEASDGLITAMDVFTRGHAKIEGFAVQRRYLPSAPVEIIWGELPQRAHEEDLNYVLSLDQNQNHGFFPDMQPGREWVKARAEGKRVLNLFAYTCSLSVAAIAGGAESVVNLDQSSRSLTTGRENHRLNFEQAACRRSTYLAHDLFKSWGRLKRLAPFDIVILDPPSHQPGGFIATKDYPRMLRRLGEILNPEGAEILACLNAPELGEGFLTDLFNEYLPEAVLVESLPNPKGYIEVGEGWGLKRLIYRYRS